MSGNSAAVGCVIFSGILTVLCIIAKLAGYIAWPWVWVMSPMWIIGCATMFCLSLYAFCCYMIRIWSSR